MTFATGIIIGLIVGIAIGLYSASVVADAIVRKMIVRIKRETGETPLGKAGEV